MKEKDTHSAETNIKNLKYTLLFEGDMLKEALLAWLEYEEDIVKEKKLSEGIERARRAYQN